MLTLDEELLETLRTAVAPIAPRSRPAFLEAVDAALAGRAAGPGLLSRVIAEIQPKFLNAPAADLEQPHRPSQPPRSPFRRRG